MFRTCRARRVDVTMRFRRFSLRRTHCKSEFSSRFCRFTSRDPKPGVAAASLRRNVTWFQCRVTSFMTLSGCLSKTATRPSSLGERFDNRKNQSALACYWPLTLFTTVLLPQTGFNGARQRQRLFARPAFRFRRVSSFNFSRDRIIRHRAYTGKYRHVAPTRKVF